MTDSPRATGRAGLTGGFLLYLALMTLAGGMLRAYKIEQPSFWHDELMTVRDAAYPQAKGIWRLGGYLPTRVGLWISGIDLGSIPRDRPDQWLDLGVSETSARLGSLMVGILTIPILALASLRIMSRRAAGLLTLLLVIGNWHLYWSQTARFYGLQFLFGSLALIWYFDATRRGSLRTLLGAMVFLALGFWSHWMAILVVGVFIVDWIASRGLGQKVIIGRVGWKVVLTVVLVLLGAMAYQYFKNPQSFEWTGPGRFKGHSPQMLIAAVLYMVEGPLVLFALAAFFLTLRRDRRLALYLLFAAVVPLSGLAVLASLDIYTAVRYAFVCYFGWLALAALGGDLLVEALRGRFGPALGWMPIVPLLAAMVLTDIAYFQGGGGHHPRWREACELVRASAAESDAVFFEDKPPFVAPYYLQRSDVEWVGRPAQTKDFSQFDRRSWFIVQSWSPSRGRQQSWLDKGADLKGYFNLQLVQPFRGVHVYLFDPQDRKASDQ